MVGEPPALASTTVLTAWTDTLLRTLAELGIDGRALASRAGIEPAALDDPARRIPLDAETRLWALAVAETGDPCLGLEVSRRVRPGTFHTLGQAVLSSPSLRAGLERIARYSRVTTDVAVVSIETTDASCTLSICWRSGCERPAFEAVDAVMASIVRSARFMLDRSVAPEYLQLERPEPGPACRERFERAFRCPVRYAAPDIRLSFCRGDAERPVAGGDAEMARLNDGLIAAYLAALDTPTTTKRVCDALVAQLPSGEPTLATIAASLQTSPRTLQRRLHDEGTTFREVLCGVRRDLAVVYLRRGRHSVTEISYLLGFSETATFSRAFHTWTGQSPSTYARAAARPGPIDMEDPTVAP